MTAEEFLLGVFAYGAIFTFIIYIAFFGKSSKSELNSKYRYKNDIKRNK